MGSATSERKTPGSKCGPLDDHDPHQVVAGDTDNRIPGCPVVLPVTGTRQDLTGLVLEGPRPTRGPFSVLETNWRNGTD